MRAEVASVSLGLTRMRQLSPQIDAEVVSSHLCREVRVEVLRSVSVGQLSIGFGGLAGWRCIHGIHERFLTSAYRTCVGGPPAAGRRTLEYCPFRRGKIMRADRFHPLDIVCGKIARLHPTVYDLLTQAQVATRQEKNLSLHPVRRKMVKSGRLGRCQLRGREPGVHERPRIPQLKGHPASRRHVGGSDAAGEYREGAQQDRYYRCF